MPIEFSKLLAKTLAIITIFEQIASMTCLNLGMKMPKLFMTCDNSEFSKKDNARIVTKSQNHFVSRVNFNCRD